MKRFFLRLAFAAAVAVALSGKAYAADPVGGNGSFPSSGGGGSITFPPIQNVAPAPSASAFPVSWPSALPVNIANPSVFPTPLALQPVSLATLPPLSAGSAVIGNVGISNTPTVVVSAFPTFPPTQNIAPIPTVTSGPLGSLNAAIVFQLPAGTTQVNSVLTGAFSGTVFAYYSDDNIVYTQMVDSTNATFWGSPSRELFLLNGHPYFKLVATAYTSGTPVATLTASSNPIGMISGLSGATATVSNDGVIWTKNCLATSSSNKSVCNAQTGTIAAAAAGPVVLKNNSGYYAGSIVTTAGTTGSVTLYDNASACSGTILDVVPGTTSNASATAGYRAANLLIPFNNGLTACGGTGSAALTIVTY